MIGGGGERGGTSQKKARDRRHSMRSFVLIALLAAVCSSSSPPAHGTDARVVYVVLPNEDVVAEYVESAPAFTVRLRAKSASVERIGFFIGDGAVAVELKAHPSNGFVFQGRELLPPHVFKKGSTVKVLPGYKRPEDLPPGSVYVELPGVTFEVPKKK
jgi:hypothetical protein